MLCSMEMKILDSRIGTDDRFPMPSRGTKGSAGIDLMACLDENFVLKAGETKKIKTGIAIYLKDANYVGKIYPRSSLGTKNGIVLGNLVGVIDADYQGEILVCLWNRSNVDYTIKVGERIAQYVVARVEQPAINIVEEFSEKSSRGEGGFGSTNT